MLTDFGIYSEAPVEKAPVEKPSASKEEEKSKSSITSRRSNESRSLSNQRHTLGGGKSKQGNEHRTQLVFDLGLVLE